MYQVLLVVSIFTAVLVMFAEPSYTFNEEDGTGTIELVKSGSSLEPFTIRVFGGIIEQKVR